MPEVWDVAVIGAGPAGSSLAVRLAKQGWSVLLLDQTRFPRTKICGEFFGPGCVPLLAELGAEKDVLRRATPIPGIRATSPGGVTFQASYPPQRQAFTLPRTELDYLLLENARQHRNVTVWEEFRAEDLIVEHAAVKGVRGRSRRGHPSFIRAGITVGADGRNSLAARRLGLFRAHSTHRRFSLGVHLAGVSPPIAGGEIFAGRGLYGILNHQGDGCANLSIVSGPDRMGLWKRNLEAGLNRLLEDLPALRSRLRGARAVEPVHALGPLAHFARRPGAPGALLVGDAAGFYDPFTGEGLLMALLDARLAAAVIDRSLRQGSLSETQLRAHAKARRRVLGPRYAAEAAVQRILSCPRTADAAAWGLAQWEALTQRLLEFFGGIRRTPWAAVDSPAEPPKSIAFRCQQEYTRPEGRGRLPQGSQRNWPTHR